ncbi:uncharacterized protein LOC131308357 [Rhododendron vialii]|uniref:uncharacterized protein LOC131308357 n=1 Tax=Rhododendron vialii TaxID=182163 RepID=UPI00265FA827|nr:uncharacterized protein LOC131308357 [Rhododendron vialii]
MRSLNEILRRRFDGPPLFEEASSQQNPVAVVSVPPKVRKIICNRSSSPFALLSLSLSSLPLCMHILSHYIFGHKRLSIFCELILACHISGWRSAFSNILVGLAFVVICPLFFFRVEEIHLSENFSNVSSWFDTTCTFCYMNFIQVSEISTHASKSFTHYGLLKER